MQQSMVRLGLAVAIALVLASPALAQKKTTLVIGLDISDGRNYDTARSADLTPPLTHGAVYDNLVTLSADDLVNVKPALATSWTLAQNGAAWRFSLRPGVKFWNGDALTADDVKFSLDRLLNIKDQPAIYAANMGEIKIIDPMTVEIAVKNPSEPLLIDLTAPSFAIYSKKLAGANGAVSEPGADQKDKATDWLNQNSPGTGPYRMTGWERNGSITLQRNPNYWGGAVPFERVVIRHISDGAAQLLAVRRDDVDIAMNLSAEQLDSLKGNGDVTVIQGASTDTLYFVLTNNGELNPSLAKREARQAVAHAVDYDGLIKGLVGGFADRPPSFLPSGIAGTTLAMTREFGYREDLAKAKQLLAAAGLANGFEFELAYPNAAYFSTSYLLMTQKIQADLARVGIKMSLKPMDNVNWRSQFNGAKLQATVAPWNSPSPNPHLWAGASVQRVAKRVGWEPPADIVDLVSKGAAEPDPAKQAAFYKRYQEILVANAHYITLMQPIYRVAAHKAVAGVQLTPNVWKMELGKIRPAS
ncbi:MAG: ABC transporter substrate-binding protein [Proteobacteria bacterium]|nr:ABC transporter substrate-binding protein [Pseudomonadota bacterium]MBI3498152.1 ABC transporter substrate-binding protein [Pseudomonadota bacterium]